jgi:hypothetical protein
MHIGAMCDNFLHITSNVAWISTSFNCKPPPLCIQCVCTHLIDLMGIHFLCCAHGNECMGTHDAIHNTFVAIARNVRLYMGQEQLHALFLAMFDSSCWWVNIVLTKDEIHTLVDTVITNPMLVDVPPQPCTTQRFVTSNATQAKERNYHDRHPTNQFFPLAIEVFKCSHK